MVIDPEKIVINKISELEWLRQAVINAPVHDTDGVNMRVLQLTKIGGEIAQLQRRLYEIQHPIDEEAEEDST